MTKEHNEIINVDLGERSYDVIIGSDILDDIGYMLSLSGITGSVMVLTNPVIEKIYSSIIMDSLAKEGFKPILHVIPAGERFKTLKTISNVYSSIVANGLDRKSALIALGGGIIGDMTGFAAATYMRGISFFQIPTSLLAQVDASVGGKTGVDLPEGKNLVGAFHQPKAVLIDTATLITLPLRELRCGLAEVLKYGIIYDQKLFDFIQNNSRSLLQKKQEYLKHIIKRSVEIKREVVQTDEHESGIRAILNYGHTIGHALEKIYGYGKLKHGEAVALGMITEAIIAENAGVAASGLAESITDALKLLNLPVNLDITIRPEDIVSAMQSDKKTVSGKLKFALPSKIGSCIITDNIDDSIILSSIKKHQAFRN